MRMGGTKMKKLLFIVGLLFVTNSMSDGFADFKKQQKGVSFNILTFKIKI